jgi:acylphosphatase
MTPRVASSVVVAGRVQGVGFRRFAADAAARHGVAGWVRNRRDGTVEALGEGTPESLERWIEEMRRGPPFGRVEAVRVESRPPTGASGFRVDPTA